MYPCRPGESGLHHQASSSFPLSRSRVGRRFLGYINAKGLNNVEAQGAGPQGRSPAPSAKRAKTRVELQCFLVGVPAGARLRQEARNGASVAALEAVPGAEPRWAAPRWGGQEVSARAQGHRPAELSRPKTGGGIKRGHITTKSVAGPLCRWGQLRDTNTWWTQLAIHNLLGRGRHRDLLQVGASV